MMMHDGYDEETVVMALFHDVGFTVCPDRHAEFAADLLAPYLGERNAWVLRHHAIFQQHHIHYYAGLDPRAREQYRGYPHFEAAAEFVERYDIVAIDPERETAPIGVFEPMAYGVLTR